MVKLNRTVALVGMMGAGKSSVGRRLASRLNVPFKDADTEIELAAGCPVSEIFSRYGEPAFREGERKVIARLLGEPPMILATGGGAFINAETRARLKECTMTVWISVPLEVLMRRVQRRNTRPLLQTTDPQATLEKLLAERTPIYAQADLTVESHDGPHATPVDEIIAALKTQKILEGA
jgi:shikimate kinase